MSELHFLNNLLMLPERENQGLTPPFGSNSEINVGCITDPDICLFSFLFAWRQTEVVNLHLTLLSCFLPRSSPLPPPSATSPCTFYCSWYFWPFHPFISSVSSSLSTLLLLSSPLLICSPPFPHPLPNPTPTPPPPAVSTGQRRSNTMIISRCPPSLRAPTQM